MFKKKNTEAPNMKPLLITDHTPFEYIEAHKSLRTNVSFITGSDKRKIIVTSALRDEGKSCLAINLAISLAQTGSKVLLIDADMRNPSIHAYLRLTEEVKAGLSNLLQGNAKVGDCLIKTEFGVDVIPGGEIPPNPAELISSDAMRDLLNIAAKHYDYIICDAPPVGIITDAAALSPMCDGVLYVIRQNYANRNQVHDAITKLKAVDAKFLGTVLTRYMIPKDVVSRYGYRKYGNRYGYGYGYGYGPSENGK